MHLDFLFGKSNYGSIEEDGVVYSVYIQVTHQRGNKRWVGGGHTLGNFDLIIE